MADLVKSLSIARKTISHFSKSTLSRQMLVTIQEELGLAPKYILVGTKNRWFYELSEAERLVNLRPCLEEFQKRRQPGDGRRSGAEDDDQDEDLIVPEKLEEEDFYRLEKYVSAVKPFTALSKFLSGEKYPTGGCLIPALEQIKEDVENLRVKEDDEDAQRFLEAILKNMTKRFKDNWTKKAPFNCLTFLDPRNVDLYALDEEVFEKIVNDIKFDSVYEVDAASYSPGHQAGSSTPLPDLEATDKRAKLLKRKLGSSNTTIRAVDDTFEAKLEAEIYR